MKASSSKGEGELSWVWCVSFLPPSIYMREPRPKEASSAADLWQTDILIQLASSTCPIQVGGAHGQVGRPCRSAGLPVGPLVIGMGIGFCYVGFLLWWALYSIFWHVSCPDSPERRVLDQTSPLCCKISSKSPAHILEHHLWNSLVNKSILAFIPHYGSFLCRSWRSKWVVSDRQQSFQGQFIILHGKL